MKITCVNDLNGSEFQQAMEIYSYSFPDNEKRSIGKTKTLLKSKKYNLYVVKNNNGVIAFALIYVWKSFAMIDYFAVSSKHRKKGIGKRMFHGLVEQLNRDAILFEVQIPDNSNMEKISRLKFYEDLGAHCIINEYMMPSYDENDPEKMYLMAVTMRQKKTVQKRNNKICKTDIL